MEQINLARNLFESWRKRTLLQNNTDKKKSKRKVNIKKGFEK